MGFAMRQDGECGAKYDGRWDVKGTGSPDYDGSGGQGGRVVNFLSGGA